MEFQNKVVIVTGAARGIGFAIAEAFVAQGATVYINDLLSEAVDTAVTMLRQSYPAAQVLPLAADASSQAAISTAVDQVISQSGQVDVLVNNAGIMIRMPSETLTAEAWKRGMSINLDGPFYWSLAVAQRSMIARRKGAIVNVASLAGLVAIPNAATYVASKHGVVGLTKALAIDWGRHNIRVNALCPGMTWTDLSKADQIKNPQMFIDRESRIPLGTAATTAEQAQAALFLASDRAAAATGLIMNVDGGQLAMSSGSSLS